MNHPITLLRDYNERVEGTDKLPRYDIAPVLLGLFGEVGSILTTAKKHYREPELFNGYHQAAQEEFGDALWYLAALCRRMEITLDEAFSSNCSSPTIIAATSLREAPVAHAQISTELPKFDDALLELGQAVADLFTLKASSDNGRVKIQHFCRLYLRALQVANVSFSDVLNSNIRKVVGRFTSTDNAALPKFDTDYPSDEQLPARFEIRIAQRPSGATWMQWNGVFIGDPLTDNIADPDGYRFHDVFHFAHAAILNWSPTFRALIRHKRKSNPAVDEAQDSGRAIVVEEGLTAWIFSRAKELNFFEDHNYLSFDLLKTVQQFVAGYEVEQCPLNLWEKAILKGYEVFRLVRDNKGGIILCDRQARTVVYKGLKET